MRRTRTNKNTIAWWVRHFGFTVDLWNVYTNKWGTASLTVSCYNDADWMSQHEFYF